jgi:hypothetical protein
VNELILIATLIGNLTITSYRPVKEQTDSSPFYTSTGEHVRAGGAAASRDILCDVCMKLHQRCQFTEYVMKLHYGDWLYIDRYGYRQVNDVMGEYTKQRVKGKVVRIPIKRQIDIFVWTYEQEKSVNVQKLDVFKVDNTRRKTNPAHYEISGTGTIRGGRP